jgi:hypothetical protein
LQSVVLRAVRTLIRPLTRSNASHSFRASLEIPHRAPSGFGDAGSLATSAQAYLRDGVSPRLPQSDTLRRRQKTQCHQSMYPPHGQLLGGHPSLY